MNSEVQEGKGGKTTRVKVAIRVRPINSKEMSQGESSILEYTGSREILANGRNYSFDKVFRDDSLQSTIYEECIRDLVMKCFSGYNAAVLAYGQTGTGKTYTMGTSGAYSRDSQAGIIPRVIDDIFKEIEARKGKAQITTKVSFLQIYKEELIDLLSDGQKNPDLAIREEKDGSVVIYGINEETVTSAEEMFEMLEKGGKHRTTKATDMNNQSSRSHGIFTVFIEQKALVQSGKDEQGYMVAKFFFVDLAGSERITKTGTTGQSLREGIKINLGLLELGNVISALSNIDQKQTQYITFRNSKLTRILQDCLGGNSNTYMIACLSPTQKESINTLNYANKAMNIKNTPVINRDPQTQLKQRIAQLEAENRRLKQLLTQKGVTFEESFSTATNADEKKAREQAKLAHKHYESALNELKEERRRGNDLEIKMYETRREKDILQLRFEQIMKTHPELLQQEISSQLKEQFQLHQKEQLGTLEKYMTQIEELKSKVQDKDRLHAQLQTSYERILKDAERDEQILLKKNALIHTLVRENYRLKQAEKKEMQKKETEEESAVDLPTSSQISVDGDQEGGIQELEIIEKDEIIVEKAKALTEQENAAREEIEAMQRAIIEQEKNLQKMSYESNAMSCELIAQMKNQHHQKLALLEKQNRTLMKQKDEGSVLQKSKYEIKLAANEKELKEYRKKMKDQQKLEHTVSAQERKLQQKQADIKKIKVQKAEVERKLQQDRHKFEKLKQQRVNDLLKAKKEFIQKDSTISKLKIDNTRKTIAHKTKEEELKRMKRVNETLKTFLKPVGRKKEEPELKSPSEKDAHELIKKALQRILAEIDTKQCLQRYVNKISETQIQLDGLIKEDSKLKLRLERLRLQEEELGEEELKAKGELQLVVGDLNQRINIAEDSIQFSRIQYEEMLARRSNTFDVDSEVIFTKAFESQQALRTLVRSAFGALRNIAQDNYVLGNEKQQNGESIRELNETVGTLRGQMLSMSIQYNQKLAQMREYMQSREYEQPQVTPQGKYGRVDEKERRNMEKQLVDLSKNNRQLSHDMELWKRKCQVVHQKYQNIRNMLSKDKNIGRQQEAVQRRNVQPASVLNQLNEMMDSIDKIKKDSSKSKSVLVVDQNQRNDDRDPDFELPENRWECVGKIDAHSSAILSMALHSNILISTATKSLKIWDLQTKKIISDLSGPHLAGLVKFVLVDPERRLMFTACEKTVTIWDLITLEVQGTLKSHKDDVRTIHNSGDYLFTGGKGLANSGSLLIWDLRNLNPNQAFEEKEKSQDIFAFASHDNILYYGNRNHSIRRMNIHNFQIMSPFEPPHLDSVTGLAIVNGSLVSGAKDKNLRLWSLDNSINNTKHTLNAFNDYVTTVHSTPNSIFYAGSKDGQIKVCAARKDRIEVVGGMMTHTQAVNAICPLEENPLNFVTASADKTIKIWQPSRQTYDSIFREEEEYCQ